MINILHLGDITKINGAEVPIVDVITGGSPCQDLSVAGKRAGLAGERSGLFMEQMRIVKEQRAESKKRLIAKYGESYDKTKISPRYLVWENVCHCGTTLITTSTGYKYIKDVEIGELVRTHDGTYHKVIQTYKTEMRPTIKVKFQGGMVECTSNHPFLTEDLTYKPIGEFKVGDRVGFKVDEPGTKSIGMATAYAFGRWLADGSVAIRNDRKTKHRIFISTGYKKYEDLKAELSKLPYRINEQKMDWAVNFTFSSDEFGELTDSAGYGARNKQVPEWVFDLIAEERDEVLRGYLAGDGHFRADRGTWNFSTSSEKLALGLCRLIRAIYHIGVSLSFREGQGTTVIDGREVAAHDYWVGEFTLPTKYAHNLNGVANASKYANGYVWCCIRDIKEGEIQDVYNLSVEDNNTYESNGVICHNCGAFSSGDPAGSDFQAVLEEICKVVRHDCPVVPIPKDGWPYAGNLDGVGDDNTPFSVCWRVHDAQYWGVAQRRRRVSVVADFGGTSAPEILFEPYSVSGNSKQSTEKGQGTSGDSSDSLGETSRNEIGESDRRQVEEFLDAVNESTQHQQDLIQSDLGVARTLACGTHASGPHLTKTLITTNSDAKVYGICSFDSNAMKSDNPESGVYEADSARTLDLNGGNPACNQGGMAVVQGTDIYNGSITGDVAATVTTASGTPGGSGPAVIAFTQNEREEVRDLNDVAGAISAESGTHQQNYVMQPAEECLNPWDVQSKHIQPENGVAESLYAGEARYGGGESYVLQNQEPVLLESSQEHATVQTNGVSTTLPASMGEGGGYVPMVCIEGNGSRDSHKGDGYSETETMYTLNTVEQHAVCYGFNGQAGASVGMPIDEEVSPTMVVNQIPNAAHSVTSTDAYGVVAKGNGDAFINPNTHTALSTGGGEPGQGYPCVLETKSQVVFSDVAATLTENDGSHGVHSQMMKHPEANFVVEMPNPKAQCMETYHCQSDEELAQTLKARDYKDPQVVAFEPGAASRVGGHVYEDDKAGTLRADAGDNQQAIVQSAGFCTEHSAKAHGIGYQVETAPTLRGGVVPATCITESKAVESHAQDARYNVGEVNQPLSANMEHDAANGGLVYAVDQGAGKSGCNIETDMTPTLTTTHGGEPAVCYEPNKPAAFKKSSHAKSADDGQGWESTEVNDTLNAFDQGETRTPTLVLNDQGGQQMQVSEDQTATLRAEEHGHQPLVFDASRRHDYKPFGDVSETVQATYGTGGNNTPMVMDMLNLNPQETEKSMTLNAYNGTGGNNTPMVFENHGQDTRFSPLGDTCQTVSATWGMGGNNQPLEVKPQQAVVRRLTCLECERLQGFPDYWTHIGEWTDSKGKKHKDSDAPKYKALGNSIALPFWFWMAGRMVDQLKKSGVEHPTMASLFDGIAGFPYVYIRQGCMPLWTSEIEEFPIAVCRKHFGDEETGEVGDIEEYLKLPVNWVTNEDTVDKAAKPIIAFDRAAYNQGPNAKYDFSVEEDTAQTLVARGPGGGLPVTNEVVGSICASDYKGIRNQDIDDGKWVVQPPTES